MGTLLLEALNKALLAGTQTTIKAAHDALLKHLRGDGPAPDWDLFPLARDFFLQNWL